MLRPRWVEPVTSLFLSGKVSTAHELEAYGTAWRAAVNEVEGEVHRAMVAIYETAKT
jgi:hypothetical protein